MKLLGLFSRNLTQMFVALGFVFVSLVVQAEMDLKEQVKLLNKSKSVEGMSSALKEVFWKPGDKKQIDKDAKAISKLAAKSKWKYEVKGQEIAFKVDGKIQFTFKSVDINQGEFLFNGQKFVINPRLSYKDHKEKMSKILRKHANNLEDFFINRAYAGSSGTPQASGPGTNLGNAGSGVIASAGVAGAAAVVSKNDKYRARKCVREQLNERSATSQDVRGTRRYRRNLLSRYGEGLVDLKKHHFQRTRGNSGYNAVMHGDEHSGWGYRSWRTWSGRMNAMVANHSGYHGGDGYIGNRDKRVGYHYAPECAGKQGRMFSGSCYGACLSEEECMQRCVGAKMKTSPGWWAMKQTPAYNHCKVSWEIYRNCLQCDSPWLDHRNNCVNQVECTRCNTETKKWEPEGCVRLTKDYVPPCDGPARPTPPAKPTCVCENGHWKSPQRDKSGNEIPCDRPAGQTCEPPVPACTGCDPNTKKAVPAGCRPTDAYSDERCSQGNDDDNQGPCPDGQERKGKDCVDAGGGDYEDVIH